MFLLFVTALQITLQLLITDLMKWRSKLNHYQMTVQLQMKLVKLVAVAVAAINCLLHKYHSSPWITLISLQKSHYRINPQKSHCLKKLCLWTPVKLMHYWKNLKVRLRYARGMYMPHITAWTETSIVNTMRS